MVRKTDLSKIEILSVDLLKDLSNLVNQFRQLSLTLGKGLGWHYLLDLSWAASQLSPSSVGTVLDAGAGTGVMQWWLAGHGINVISVNRGSRYHLPDQFWKSYKLKGLRRNDLSPSVNFTDSLPPRSFWKWSLYLEKLVGAGKRLWWSTNLGKQGGTVLIYNQDLTHMPHIPDNSVDAVVSISALEHNSQDGLRRVISELMRVLKPGCKLLASLGAAKDKDWFHEPSKGWCYTEATLRDIFEITDDCPSNYNQYDDLFTALKSCSDLREELADFYFKSGDNGMPWGIWNPEYQPVGVVKVKK